MSDGVMARLHAQNSQHIRELEEADAEIERLRKALEEIAGSGPVDADGNEDAYAGWNWCYERANAALSLNGEGKENE